MLRRVGRAYLWIAASDDVRLVPYYVGVLRIAREEDSRSVRG